MDLIAFTLRADYAGTVTQDRGDGPEDVPKFTGGLLYTATGDFEVKTELDAGGGTIVVHADDAGLVELLDAYPALKRTPAPDGAEPISRYDRQTIDSLRHAAKLRPIAGARGLSRDDLIAALEHDDAVRRGDVQASTVAAGDASPEPADATGQTTTEDGSKEGEHAAR